MKEERQHFQNLRLVPNEKGGTPSYAQKTFGTQAGGNNHDSKLELLVSDNGRQGSLRIKQNAAISRLTLKAGETWQYGTEDQKGYLHMISGNVQAMVDSETNAVEIGAGDALGMYEQDIIRLKASEESVALWFELPK